MTGATDDLIERIVQAVPRLRPLLEELRSEEMGEQLPVMFLEEACTPLVDRVVGGDQGALDELATIAELLDEAFGTDADVDWATEGFLVHIPPMSAPGGDIRRLLGPKLTARLNRMREVLVRPEEQAFVERLAGSVPALESLVEENRDDAHGDVLTHLFLSDVARREIDNHASGDSGTADEVRSVLDVLEREFGRDEGVDNAIAASFLEHLPYVGEPGADITRLLGPALTVELNRQRPPVTDQ